MIVDLDLRGRTVLVVGGGRQAQKRLGHLLGEECNIILVSADVTSQIGRWGESKEITIKKQQITDTGFISDIRPDVIITTTDSTETNQMIIRYAKRNGITAYSSDNPEESDFANPAIIDFEGAVQVAIFTGGQSPAMSKRIRERLEGALGGIIKKEDVAQIRLQKTMRAMAKDAIPDQARRRERLKEIMDDDAIGQLIKDGRIKRAEERAAAMLGGGGGLK